MMKIIVCSLLAGLAFQLIGVETVPKSGPFEIVIKRLELCDDVGTGEIRFEPKINSKGNGLYTYTNPVNISVPWDKDLNTDVEVQQLSSGVYRPRFITQSLKGCQGLMKLGKSWAVGFFGAAGYNFTSCPIPADVYHVKEWVVELKLNNMPTMIYNSYKVFLTFYSKGKKVGCQILYAEVVPK